MHDTPLFEYLQVPKEISGSKIPLPRIYFKAEPYKNVPALQMKFHLKGMHTT